MTVALTSLSTILFTRSINLKNKAEAKHAVPVSDFMQLGVYMCKHIFTSLGNTYKPNLT